MVEVDIPFRNSVDKPGDGQGGGISDDGGKRRRECHQPEDDPPAPQVLPLLRIWLDPAEYPLIVYQKQDAQDDGADADAEGEVDLPGLEVLFDGLAVGFDGPVVPPYPGADPGSLLVAATAAVAGEARLAPYP